MGLLDVWSTNSRGGLELTTGCVEKPRQRAVPSLISRPRGIARSPTGLPARTCQWGSRQSRWLRRTSRGRRLASTGKRNASGNGGASTCQHDLVPPDTGRAPREIGPRALAGRDCRTQDRGTARVVVEGVHPGQYQTLGGGVVPPRPLVINCVKGVMRRVRSARLEALTGSAVLLDSGAEDLEVVGGEERKGEPHQTRGASAAASTGSEPISGNNHETPRTYARRSRSEPLVLL